ncbi:DUF3993 domain-containing protein [Mesobacillus maritimus]|uniref:DUF3993 domain-containing protein n=1 Tax=Mesobacillus maritimus TaxID=1643336 RepID=A0ABS7K617_9BACI|nr:DUF3993 domain-containing protein [Mesobacillus maritimus]MBY0097704.1 DUF3993 domain-containing protein [Mesobacillus maritimus]
MDKRLKVFIFCVLSLIIVLPLQVKSEKELQLESATEKEIQVVDTIKTEVHDYDSNETVIQKIGVEEKQSEDFIQDKQGIFEHLKSAFMAQVSLSEKGRSLKEVGLILEPYFSNSFIELFLNENIVEESGQYLTYGSDFAPYYIPFYSYSDKTRVVNHNDSIFVVEYFPAVTEGPVNYEGHFQAVEMEREEKGLKVTKIWYENIPEEVLNF